MLPSVLKALCINSHAIGFGVIHVTYLAHWLFLKRQWNGPVASFLSGKEQFTSYLSSQILERFRIVQTGDLR